MSLTLKIMADENRSDCDLDTEYLIVGGVKEIRFQQIIATAHERSILGLKCLLGHLGDKEQIQEWSVCVAECTFPDSDVVEHFLLTGHCYVINDQGQTVDTYWPRNKVVDAK